MLVVESRVGETTIAALRERGHIVEVAGPWSEGRLTAAARDRVPRRAACRDMQPAANSIGGCSADADSALLETPLDRERD